MLEDMGIKLGVDSDTDVPTNTLASILSDNSLTYTPRILKMEELEEGEYFQGLVYVKKSNYRKNKFNDSYDLRMYCVDGNGFIFTATCFNTKTKSAVENKIILVERGIKVENFHGNVFYNIERLMVYGGQDVPITAFIKEIDNKGQYLLEYENLIKRLETNNPLYGGLVAELNKYLNFKEVLQVSPYKQMLGNRLGSALRVMVETVNAYTSVNSLVKKREEKDIDLFTLVTLLYFTQPTIESYNLFHGTTFDKEREEELKLPIKPFLMNMIYQSAITKEEKAKIISILMNRESFDQNIKIKGKFPMETLFFSMLKVVETTIQIEDTNYSK